jgi:hypothetical protein
MICTDSKVLKRPNLFQRIVLAIRRFIFNARHRKSSFMVWAEKEVAIAKKREHDHKDKDDCPSMGKYVDSVYDCALKLAKTFDKQEHSGMSAWLASMLFRKLVSWKPLSPLNGTEDEWHSKCNFEDVPGNLHQQNRRCSSVFRKRKTVNDPWEYSYNEVLDIVNSDDVWKTYPPVDDPGTLDDNDPKVMAYIEKSRALRDKLNAEIKFPYTPKTFKYRWNFTTEEFEAE